MASPTPVIVIKPGNDLYEAIMELLIMYTTDEALILEFEGEGAFFVFGTERFVFLVGKEVKIYGLMEIARMFVKEGLKPDIATTEPFWHPSKYLNQWLKVLKELGHDLTDWKAVPYDIEEEG
jgi:hypothetical protein